MTLEIPAAIRPNRLRPPGQSPILNLDELWRRRELCWLLAWRSVRVRYKQTAIGAGWAVLQPLLLMLVFTVFFGLLNRVPSDGIPYPVFVYIGLTAWQFIARAFNEGAASIANSPHLVTKIYFPRLCLPVSAVLACLVALFFGLIVLGIMLVWYGIAPGWPALLLPLFVLLAVLTAMAAALPFAAAYAAYRDVGHLLPFLTQVWMFASPIIYPSSLLPDGWRRIYDLNPMVAVADGFHWALAGGPPPSVSALVSGVSVTLSGLVFGYVFFRRAEATMSDLV